MRRNICDILIDVSDLSAFFPSLEFPENPRNIIVISGTSKNSLFLIDFNILNWIKYILRKQVQSMLLSLSPVTNNSTVENALSGLAHVKGIIFKASLNFILCHDPFTVDSINYNSCCTILFKLELLLVEQLKAFVFERNTFSNFYSTWKILLSKFPYTLLLSPKSKANIRIRHKKALLYWF